MRNTTNHFNRPSKANKAPNDKPLSNPSVWSPEGKAARPDKHNWSIKTKKERKAQPTQVISRNDAHRKMVYARMMLAQAEQEKNNTIK